MSDDFKLFTDKPTTFECKFELPGAQLSELAARLVVESADRTLMFKGKVNEDGTCVIPVPKLKGILDENTSGKMCLEVIADDTYFQPWESKFVVAPSRQLTTEIKTPEPSPMAQMKVEVKKPKDSAKATLRKPDKAKTVVREIIEGLIVSGITASNALKKKTEIKRAIEEHILLSGLNLDPTALIPEIVKSLPKR